MVTLIVCVKRRADLTFEQFDSHWRDRHGPLIRGCTEFARHIRSYVQYHLVGQDLPIAAMFGVSGEYDGIAALTFDDVETMERAFNEPRYLGEIREDEARFVDAEGCLTFLTSAMTVKS